MKEIISNKKFVSVYLVWGLIHTTLLLIGKGDEAYKSFWPFSIEDYTESYDKSEWFFYMSFPIILIILINAFKEKSNSNIDENLNDQKSKEIKDHKKDFSHQEYIDDYYEFEQIFKSFHDKNLNERKLKENNEYKKDYSHQEYVDEYYNLEQIYNSELGKEAFKRKTEILYEIKNLTDQEYDLEYFGEIVALKKIKWRKYFQLGSLSDENGNPKAGRELEIARIERQYRKESKKFFEWLPTNKFESTLRRIEQNMVDDGISPDSQEFKIARDKWIKDNTVIAYTDKFYKERNQIIIDLKDFMAKLPQSTQDLVDSSGEMGNMLDLTIGFRDQDGQIIGGDFSQTSKDKIKEYQKSIQDKKKSLYNGLTDNEQSELDALSNLNKTLSPDENLRYYELMNKGIRFEINIFQKAELARLFLIPEIHSNEATDYYTDIVNNYLDKMGEKPFDENNKNNVDSLLDPGNYVRLFCKSPEFEMWFKENHITKEVYDRESGEITTKYERLFIWNRNRPNNQEHYEKITLSDGEQILGKPCLSYYFRSVRKEYRIKEV